MPSSASGTVTSDHGISAEQIAAIDRDVQQLIDEAVAFAESSPDPDAAALMTDVYIKY